MWSISVDAAHIQDLIMDVCSCIPGRHQQDEAMHFCCGQPPRHGCEKRNVFFNNLEMSSELLEMEWNGQTLLALLDIFLQCFKAISNTWAAASCSVCSFTPSLHEFIIATETQSSAFWCIKLTHDKWVLHPWHRLAFTPLRLRKAHSHLRGLTAEDGFFGVRGGWQKPSGDVRCWWVKKWDPRNRNCGLMLLDVWLFSYEQSEHIISEPSIHFDSLHSLLSHPTWAHLLLGCNLLTRCIRRAWAALSQKEGHLKVPEKGHLHRGKWQGTLMDHGFWGTKFDTTQILPLSVNSVRGDERVNSLPGYSRS